MSAPDVVRLTTASALRLFAVCATSSALAYGAYEFLPGTATGAYLFTVTVALAALTFPPLVVLAIAAACRRPIDQTPRWFLVIGAVVSLAGIIAAGMTHANWATVLFAAGVWLLLVGAGAVLTVGLLKAWG